MVVLLYVSHILCRPCVDAVKINHLFDPAYLSSYLRQCLHASLQLLLDFGQFGALGKFLVGQLQLLLDGRDLLVLQLQRNTTVRIMDSQHITTTHLHLRLFVPQLLLQLLVQVVQRRRLALRMQIPLLQRRDALLLVLLLRDILAQIALQLQTVVLRLAVVLLVLRQAVLQLVDAAVQVGDAPLPLRQLAGLLLDDCLQLVLFGRKVDGRIAGAARVPVQALLHGADLLKVEEEPFVTGERRHGGAAIAMRLAHRSLAL